MSLDNLDVVFVVFAIDGSSTALSRDSEILAGCGKSGSRQPV
jgi:hypothetical protein